MPGLRDAGLTLCRQSEGDYELYRAPHSEQDEQYWYSQQPPLHLEHPRLNLSVPELSSNLKGEKIDALLHTPVLGQVHKCFSHVCVDLHSHD